jgi:hypothetical protein
VKIETPKSVAPVSEPADDLSSETPINQPNVFAITNAADPYRQAFALYDALTNDEKNILRDWRTNVDASTEAELCEKIRPICDLMHQASTVTNCDWGIEPITEESLLHKISFNSARGIARTAVWSAAHCRSNDIASATDDLIAVLHLGQQISSAAMIGHLVGIALQGLASSYVSENLERFGGADAQRLAAVFNDPSYEQASAIAMREEESLQDRLRDELAAKVPSDVEKGFSKSAEIFGDLPTNLDATAILAGINQSIDLERKLASALASSSADEYETWRKEADDLEASSPMGKFMLQPIESFMDRVQAAEVNRSLVVAGLAVAQGGTDALPSYPDPSSGQPFAYTETADGFQLQSTYQLNGKPMTMQFK